VNRDKILADQLKEEGGSAAAGRPTYDERCAACHRFGAIG
jgi:mono/diheme cytochrome c family protein